MPCFCIFLWPPWNSTSTNHKICNSRRGSYWKEEQNNHGYGEMHDEFIFDEFICTISHINKDKEL